MPSKKPPQKAKGKQQKKPQRDLTPRQKKLVKLLPAVQAGTKTKVQAMREAGYSEKSAHQQSEAFGSLRNNVKMQEALRAAGVTEEFLAQQIKDGTAAWRKGMFGTNPDFQSRAAFVKIGAELLDVYPSTKVEDVTPPQNYGDLENRPKAKTLDEARALAEKGEGWDEED